MINLSSRTEKYHREESLGGDPARVDHYFADRILGNGETCKVLKTIIDTVSLSITSAQWHDDGVWDSSWDVL